METSYQKFAKDALVIGIASVLTSVSGLVLLPLITKLLGAHDYGVWAQVNITIGLLWMLVNLGLPFAMVRFLAAKTNRAEIQEGFYSVFSVIFLAALIASSLLIIFAGPIARVFFEGETEIVRILGVIIIMSSLNLVCLTLFRTFRQMMRYSIFAVTKTYIHVGIIAYLALNGFGIFSIVLSMLVIEAALFLALFYSISSQIGIKKPHFSILKEYFSFGLPTIPANISSWVVMASDRYIISYFLGLTSVGIYSAGYGLGSGILMAVTLLGFVLPPTLSKLYDEGRMDEVKTHLSYSLKYFLALAIPFVFGAAMLSQQVLRMFTTTEIAAQGYFVVPLVALSILVFGFGGVIGNILVLVKKTRIMGATWIIAGLVNLGLNILVIPRIGILGAALTTLIAFAMAAGILIYYSFKEFKFNIDWGFIIKSLVASMIMSLAIWLIFPEGTLTVLLTVVAGIVIYGVALFLMRGFKREEIRFFQGLLRRSAPPKNSNK